MSGPRQSLQLIFFGLQIILNERKNDHFFINTIWISFVISGRKLGPLIKVDLPFFVEYPISRSILCVQYCANKFYFHLYYLAFNHKKLSRINSLIIPEIYLKIQFVLINSLLSCFMLCPHCKPDQEQVQFQKHGLEQNCNCQNLVWHSITIVKTWSGVEFQWWKPGQEQNYICQNLVRSRITIVRAYFLRVKIWSGAELLVAKRGLRRIVIVIKIKIFQIWSGGKLKLSKPDLEHNFNCQNLVWGRIIIIKT